MEASQASFKEEIEAGQEFIKEKMKAGQESVKQEMRLGQEEMKREIACMIENKFEAMEGRINTAEDKVGEIQERVSAVEQQIEGGVSAVQQQIDKRVSAAVDKEVDTLRKCIATEGSNSEGLKFLPMPARPSLNLLIYDGKTSWQVYEIQFPIVSDANGWNYSLAKL
ncbi:hypothetical protein X975_17303, partial [Stegodyphus mimosarum]